MDNNDRKEMKGIDKRFFIRFHSIFPVEFRLINDKSLSMMSPWLQGYTNNVGRGGICLETVFLEKASFLLLGHAETIIEINIRIPFSRQSIKAKAKYVWFRADQEGDLTKYFIGVKFLEISDKNVNQLIRAAKWHRMPSRSLVLWLIFMFCSFLFVSYYGFDMQRKHEKLITNYIEVSQQQGNHVVELKDIMTRKETVVKLIESHPDSRQANTTLEEEYKLLLGREKILADKLKLVSFKKDLMQEDVLDTMHHWLVNHQNQSTGLIKSFEGDVDLIEDWAFVYDQALAVNVFLLFDNYSAAEKILNFFKRNFRADFQGYSNAYYYDSEEISEFMVHCGPNIWLGVAIMQYQDKTGNDQYLEIAEAIAKWLIRFQDADSAGGIKGGPTVHWYATEHNLDAYAFFEMLAKKTKKKVYAVAARKSLSWLKNHAMVPHDRDYPSPPIKRGLGDSTVATDTYAWSLATIGPSQLERMKMDPEAIMQYAQDHCEVTVQYERPSGNVVKVSGFDFSKVAHMPRGGMVSPEWTSQMVVSYQMLSKYFQEKNSPVKATFYSERANKYLRELNKLIISSPSQKGQGEGCLPYATLEQADTGHGWDTPMGAHTCSIAGTAYTIMAMKEYNPLMFPKKSAK